MTEIKSIEDAIAYCEEHCLTIICKLDTILVFNEFLTTEGISVLDTIKEFQMTADALLTTDKSRNWFFLVNKTDYRKNLIEKQNNDAETIKLLEKHLGKTFIRRRGNSNSKNEN